MIPEACPRPPLCAGLLEKAQNQEPFQQGTLIQVFLLSGLCPVFGVGDLNCAKERARKRSCGTQGMVQLSGPAPGAEVPLWVSLNTWD